MKSNGEIPESRFLGSISSQSIRNLLPKSISNSQNKMNSILTKSIFSKENAPPVNSNIQIDQSPIQPSDLKKSLKTTKISQKESPKTENQQDLQEVPSDPSVKVVVRIRPTNWREKGEEWDVRKTSPKSLSVGDRTFTFDAVVDSSSTQEDIFHLVGVPLVKNSLAGFNTSILSYGQTGSGKTYTMWGPPSAMVEGHSPSCNQGIVPRIFQMLFSEFQKEQENSEEKQMSYQCRCSFLEIYNEQIGDLLDPTQRNLEIRDDPKNGFYVENLTEEYVTSYDDVTHLLIKGLSNRKVGATSVNSKSSRSHIVFTCVIESWCKGTSLKGFSSSRTSRISLVDLAGSDRNTLDDGGRQIKKEGKSVKKSLSHLGHLVHMLAEEGAQSERSQNVPYKSSCLTHLLRESLGGNAKLTVICAISPHDKCKGETLSTLRFGQQAKSIQNEPVINEITEDDVNGLSDQIRQLKEELINAKSTGYNSIGSNSGFFKGRNPRESLNQLRISLSRSIILPHVDNDSEEEMEMDEEDVKKLCVQLDTVHSSCEENSRDLSHGSECVSSSVESCSMVSCFEECNLEDTNLSGGNHEELHLKDTGASAANIKSSSALGPASRSSLSIMTCRQPLGLQDPPMSESPKLENALKKMTPNISNLSTSPKVSESSKSNVEVLRQSVRRSDHIRESLRASKMFSSPTESLAASLHRGLQIIDHHQKNSASNKSLVALSFEHLARKAYETDDNKTGASVQTLTEERMQSDRPATSFLCASCKRVTIEGSDQVQDSLNMWVVPAWKPEGLTDPLPNDGDKVVNEASKREELEKICAEQAAKIEQLNQLVEQYKNERQHNSDIESSQEIRLIGNEAFTGSVGETKELKKDNCLSLEENKIPNEKSELKGRQEMMDHEYRAMSFDLTERESLLKEIEVLKNKLQSFVEFSNESRSSHSSKTYIDSYSLDKNDERLDEERRRWTEKESEWICLTDDLRVDLESNRRHAEHVESELRLEKKVTEELDDALDRSVLGHARIVEHYADLQDKYNELLGRYQRIMQGIAEVNKAAAKAGKKGNGAKFVKALTAELSALRVEREREREHLRKENRSLRIQLKDTAEAVHAAGELLVRLREAEQAVSVAEENYMRAQQETEKVKKQMEKQKRKHAMEMVTMKQYLAESRLPESALRPIQWDEEERPNANTTTPLPDDDQAWRAEFGAIYQEHY